MSAEDLSLICHVYLGPLKYLGPKQILKINGPKHSVCMLCVYQIGYWVWLSKPVKLKLPMEEIDGKEKKIKFIELVIRYM